MTDPELLGKLLSSRVLVEHERGNWAKKTQLFHEAIDS